MFSVSRLLGFSVSLTLAFAALVSDPAARAQVFVANQGNNTVSRVSTNGTSVANLGATGLNVPAGITFGAGGNLYVSNLNSNIISRVNPTTGVTTTFATVSNPYFSAYRASSTDLFVTDISGNNLLKVNAVGVVSTFATGFNSPTGVAVAANGDLFVASLNGVISRVNGSTGSVSTFVTITGTNDIESLAFDSAGNLYAADYSNNNVRQITPAAVYTTFASGFRGPEGLAFATNGNLLVTNSANNTLSQVTPGGTVSLFASGGGLNGPFGIAVAGAAAPEPGSLALAVVALLPMVGMAGLVRRRGL